MARYPSSREAIIPRGVNFDAIKAEARRPAKPILLLLFDFIVYITDLYLFLDDYRLTVDEGSFIGYNDSLIFLQTA